MKRGSAWWSLGGIMLALACGARTPLVEVGPHPESGAPPILVREPPPPTKVETLPLRRDPECFWRGGYWQPRGSAWTWVKGAWVRPEKGCRLAPAVTRFEAIEGSTVLVHRAELWYSTDPKQASCQPKDCSDF